jgi:hypothetical protein
LNSDPRDEALLDIALAVAEGGEISWDDVRTQLPPEDAAVVNALQSVNRLATARRSLTNPQPVAFSRWGHLTILGSRQRGTRTDYAARDDALGREVILTLVGPLEGDEALTEQLLTNARLRTRVTHPNVARLYGADYVHDHVGYWVERVHGRSLAEIVASGGRFGAAHACEIVTEMCGAVAAVHDAGVADGAIVATNIVEAGDHFVLLPSLCALVGTDAERPTNNRPDVTAACSPAADVIGLANLLHFLLTGREVDAPIDSSALRDQLLQIRTDIREPIATVLTNALSADSRHRYGTAKALQQAISHASSDRLGATEWAIGFLVTTLVMLLLLWYAFATR